MNERTSGAALLIIGVVALFAAIVGGGIKIREIEVGSVPSRWRQGMLAAFGIVVGIIGLVLVIPDDNPANAAADDNNQEVDANASAGTDNAGGDAATNAAPADENAGVENNSDTGSTDGNVTQ